MKTATTTLLLLGLIVALCPTSIELLAQDSPTSADVTVPAPVDQSPINETVSTDRPQWSAEIIQQVARWPGETIRPLRWLHDVEDQWQAISGR